MRPPYANTPELCRIPMSTRKRRVQSPENAHGRAFSPFLHHRRWSVEAGEGGRGGRRNRRTRKGGRKGERKGAHSSGVGRAGLECGGRSCEPYSHVSTAAAMMLPVGAYPDQYWCMSMELRLEPPNGQESPQRSVMGWVSSHPYNPPPDENTPISRHRVD
eukprot:652376-Rhodomonas_salina.11